MSGKKESEATEWGQLTQAEINAILKDKQAREAAEPKAAPEGDDKPKRGRPAKTD